MPSEENRTTTRPPGSSPVTTPSPNLTWVTSSPTEKLADGPGAAGAEGGALGAPPHEVRASPAPHARRAAGAGLGVGVGERRGHLADEPAGHVPLASAVQRAGAGVRQEQLLARACDAHVDQAPLLLDVTRLDRARVRKHPVLHADHEDHLVLEALRVVQRHQLHDPLVVAEVVLLALNSATCWRNSSTVGSSALSVVLPRHAHQLLEVLQPAL